MVGVPGRMPGINPEAIENADMAIIAPGPPLMAAKLRASVARLRNAIPFALGAPLSNFVCAISAVDGGTSCLVLFSLSTIRKTCGICSGEYDPIEGMLPNMLPIPIIPICDCIMASCCGFIPIPCIIEVGSMEPFGGRLGRSGALVAAGPELFEAGVAPFTGGASAAGGAGLLEAGAEAFVGGASPGLTVGPAVGAAGALVGGTARCLREVACNMARSTAGLTPSFFRAMSESVEMSKSVSDTSMIFSSVSSSKWFCTIVTISAFLRVFFSFCASCANRGVVRIIPQTRAEEILLSIVAHHPLLQNGPHCLTTIPSGSFEDGVI